MTGLAAGIKVIPGIFIVLMLTTRRWADAVRASAALLATVVVGAAFGLPQAVAFWTRDLFGASDVFRPDYFANVGLRGVLARWLPDQVAAPIWLITGAAAVVFSLWLATQWWPHDRLVAACALSLGTLLASPISWDQHWVWAGPVSVALFGLWRRVRGTHAVAARRWTLGAWIAMASATLAHIHVLELVFIDVTAVFNLIASAYTLVGLAALTALTVTLRAVRLSP